MQIYVNINKLTFLYFWKNRCNGDNDAENHVETDKELVQTTVRLQYMHKQHIKNQMSTS